MYTQEQKKQIVTTKGNVLTFKTPIMWKGEKKMQIVAIDFQRGSEGEIKIIGFSHDSPWYKNEDELINAMDWDFMNQIDYRQKNY